MIYTLINYFSYSKMQDLSIINFILIALYKILYCIQIGKYNTIVTAIVLITAQNALFKRYCDVFNKG